MNEELKRMMSDLPIHDEVQKRGFRFTQVRAHELVIGHSIAVAVQEVDGEGPFGNNKERPLLVNGTVGNIQSICFPVVL